MHRFLQFSAKPTVMMVTALITGVLLVWVFPLLPLGAPMLDVLPGYGVDEARMLLAQYGEQGRAAYALASPTLDLLLPICYATFFVGTIYRCLPSEQWRWMALLPLAVAGWDLVENVQITMLLWQYPDISDLQIQLASWSSWLKARVLVPSLLLVTGLLLSWQLLDRTSRGRG